MRHKNRGRRSLNEVRIKNKRDIEKLFGDSVYDMELGEDGDHYIIQGHIEEILEIVKKYNLNFEQIEHWGGFLWIGMYESKRQPNRGRRSLSEKRQINEGNFIPKEDLERGLEKEWAKIAGYKVLVEISGKYDINDYAVYAFGSELATLRLFHYFTSMFPKPFDKDVPTYSVGKDRNGDHYFLYWGYGSKRR